MTLRLVLMLLLGALGTVDALAKTHNSARAVDSKLMGIVNEIPSCAVSRHPLMVTYVQPYTYYRVVELPRTRSQIHRLFTSRH